MEQENVNISIDQMEKVLKLCDLLAIEDFTVARDILEQYNWDLQKVIQQLSSGKQNPPQQQSYNIPPNDQQNMNIHDDYDPQEFQYEYNELEKKKEMFQEQYISMPLMKCVSAQNQRICDKIQKLSKQSKLSRQYLGYKQNYIDKLLINSQKLYEQIISKLPKDKIRLHQNKKKIQMNRKFIGYLYQYYKPKINFTFGTFLLNLTKSYLQNKYLLVYVHKSGWSSNILIEMLLQQKQIARVINQTCITYGMFDNSDDYQIVQKYLPLKDVPSFLLFKFNIKTQSQSFISSYNVIQKEGQNFIQWFAGQTGIQIKRKKVKTEINSANQSSLLKPKQYRLEDIVNTQNQQYERMELEHKLKKQQAQLQKNKIKQIQVKVIQLKQSFNQQPQFQIGKTLKIKLRMPVSGKSLYRIFYLQDKIQRIFDYVSCFGRQQFQNTQSDFDITQSFPKISLKQHINKKIKDIFQNSQGQNLIVKEE